MQEQRAEVRNTPHTRTASAAPCRAPVPWYGSYTRIRAASVQQREAQPGTAACTQG